ncbi:hypothetical protein [Amphritea sp. HPY]|uniref:hypothetical protein n=1 Tax=Amphritea sp. HPY TaxID=3421652 RepID=UPI003D7C7842
MIIGIDPDLVKSGVAVTAGGRILTLDAMSFFDLIGFIDEHKHQAVFHVENVEYCKAVYPRKGADSPGAKAKIAQNVGQVKAIGRLLEEYLKGSGANYKLIRPLVGTVKKKAKKDAEFFNRQTGWQGKSNEDKRDAALLALYGK